MNNSRWAALDNLRGLAVLGMILVVSPGSWNHRYTQLDHAAWNGWTIADIVMPLFLFCVGLAIGMKAINKRDNKLDVKRALRRTFLLIAIGLCLNAIESGSLQSVRIPGVLQRIGFCYLVAFTVMHFAHKHGRTGAYVTATLLAICFANFLLMNGLAIGSDASGATTYKHNLAAIIDRALFGVEHLWIWARDETGSVVYDPDGLLSSIFACVNVLAGIVVLYMKHTLTTRYRSKLTAFLLAVSAFLVLLAFTLDHQGIAINKKLWSVSFTFLTIGICISILLIFDWILPQLPLSDRIKKLNPLNVFGSNAILAFILSSLLLSFSGTPFISSETGDIGLQTYAFKLVGQFISEPYLASLTCAIVVSAFIYCLLIPLHLKEIYLRL